MKRLALCIQYSKYDFEQMKLTCRLLADLQKLHGKDHPELSFVFSVKKGAPVDRKTTHLMQDTFGDVRIFQGTRTEEGHPDGCNAQWAETMMWAYLERRDKRAKWDYIFTTEPDIVPLCPDWLVKLREELEKTDKMIMGVAHHDHVNGNAFFHYDYTVEKRMYGSPCGIPWDMNFGAENLKNVHDTGLMKNLYRAREVNEVELFNPRLGGIEPVFVHGIKDASGEKVVRDKYDLWALPSNV
jgi:hypothetical protein